MNQPVRGSVNQWIIQSMGQAVSRSGELRNGNPRAERKIAMFTEQILTETQ